MKLPESKKLVGMIVTISALGLVLVIGALVVVLTGADALISLFTAFGGYILGIGTAHQSAQMMADRSPNYPLPPAMVAPSIIQPQPGEGAVIPSLPAAPSPGHNAGMP